MIMSDMQKSDPPCKHRDNPCDVYHHETIDVGIPCPCNCHYDEPRIRAWSQKMGGLVDKTAEEWFVQNMEVKS